MWNVFALRRSISAASKKSTLAVATSGDSKSSEKSKPGTGASSDQATWLPLVVVCLALGVEAYDASSIPVAISAIVSDLNTDLPTIQAALVLFSVICAPLMLTAGTLADIQGKRRALRLGITLFGAGTVLAALSPHVTVFVIGFSIIKALGAVLVVPTGAALLIANYEGRRRAIAFSFLGAFLSGATAATPMIMGTITKFLGWRFGYGLSAVISVFVLLLSLRLTESRRRTGTIDWVGTFLTLIGLGCIMLGATAAGRYGWWEARRPFQLGGFELAPLGLSITPFMICAGVIVMVLFFNRSERRERMGKIPIVRLQLFHNIPYSAGVLVGALQIIGVAGLLFVIPVYLQSALDYDSFKTGLTLLPYTVALLVASLSSSVLIRWFAPKTLIQIALALMVIGLFVLSDMVDPQMTPTTLTVPLIIYGIAAGLAASLIPNLTLSAADPQETGEASGAQEAASELGSGFGAAVIGAVLIASTWSGLVSGIAEKAEWVMDREEQLQIAIELEDAEQNWTPENERTFISTLPIEVRESIDQIVVNADTQALKNSLRAILSVVLVALLASVFMSPRAEGREKKPSAGKEGQEG
jgi:MFS family permease